MGALTRILHAIVGRSVDLPPQLAEQYPELRATENFQQLQAELGNTENKIATSRQVYNDTVLTYNNAVQQIPSNIIAGMFNFELREYFELDAGDAAREPVPVKF